MDQNFNNKKPDISADKEVVDTSRRKFLRNTGIATGGVVGGAVLGGLLANPFKSHEPATTMATEHPEPINYAESLTFFRRQKDFDALSAATEVIYPEDANGPGAIALGVPYFIDKQLASPWGSNADDYRKPPFKNGQTPLTRGDIFLQGVRKLNEISENEHEVLFKDLEEDKQFAVLERFMKGEVEMNLVISAEFFALLKSSTLAGCYADPLYGGNKDMAGWKMKEYPGSQMSYIDMIEADEFILIEPRSVGGHKH